jgi:translation initiation factor 2 beta subunit (eIF-2beta)/eIF-5
MHHQRDNFSGIERLIAKYKREFRIVENLNHYSSEDYVMAEREYVRHCLKFGRSQGRSAE